MVVIGYEVSEQQEVEPAHDFVVARLKTGNSSGQEMQSTQLIISLERIVWPAVLMDQYLCLARNASSRRLNSSGFSSIRK